MELISREAAIEAITNYAKFLWDNFHETCPLAGMIDTIDALPAAERVGKWMRTDSTSGWEKNYYCSECRCEFFVETCMLRPMWNYCPNCGARMEKGEEDE